MIQQITANLIGRLRRSGWRKWFSVLLLVAAIGIAVYTVINAGSQVLVESLQFNIPLMALAFVIQVAGFFLSLFIWRIILSSYGVKESWVADYRVFTYSALALFIPGGIWSIISRTVFYQRMGHSSLAVTMASLVEMLLTGIAALILYAVATVFRPEISLWQHPELGVLIALGGLVLIHPQVFKRLVRLALRGREEEHSLGKIEFRTRDLLAWIGLEIVVLLMGGTVVFLLVQSLTTVSNASFIPLVAAWAASSAASSLFFWIPGKLVVREGALILTLSATLPSALAIVFAVLLRLWLTASLLIVTLMTWLVLDLPQTLRNRRKRPENTPWNPD